jgi:hypothetical protein
MTYGTSILSTTLENYRPQLTDNVFGDRPLSAWLMSKKRTRMLSGGSDIREPMFVDACCPYDPVQLGVKGQRSS